MDLFDQDRRLGWLPGPGLLPSENELQFVDTIVTLSDPQLAKLGMDAAVDETKKQIRRAKSHGVQIGDGGLLVTGTTSGVPTSLLAFHQGKAFVMMQFVAANDPVSTEVITVIGRKQAELIRNGLSG